MTPEQERSAIALFKAELDRESFFRVFGTDDDHIEHDSAQLLANAIREQSSSDLFYARMIRSYFELSIDPENPQTPLQHYHRLLPQDWHEEHEDIVGFLQDQADPSSVPFLRDVVLLKPRLTYLNYDDYGSFYKKCLWALQAIGTEEAVDVLREFSDATDPELQKEARYRLSKIGGSRGAA